MKGDDANKTRDQVREGYARIAAGGGGCGCGSGGGCCGGPETTKALGYAGDDLAALPEGADMGLGCGNPVALAELASGERVLDLGSGGGLDIYLAGPRVGPAGRAIGVDMTPEMLAKARRGLAAYRERSGLDNVEFRLGEIEHLPSPDADVDVVLSNCVINLSPDKAQVWREIARVLRPGGRVAVSDLALLKPLPESVREDVGALIGCVAGAVPVDETEAMVREAGLVDIELKPHAAYIEAMTEWQDPLYRGIAAELPEGQTIGDYVTSLEIRARKPKA